MKELLETEMDFYFVQLRITQKKTCTTSHFFIGKIVDVHSLHDVTINNAPALQSFPYNPFQFLLPCAFSIVFVTLQINLLSCLL